MKKNNKSAVESMFMPAPYGLFSLYDAPYVFPMYDGMPLTQPEDF